MPIPNTEIGRVTTGRASGVKSRGDTGIILALVCVAAASSERREAQVRGLRGSSGRARGGSERVPATNQESQ